MCLSVLVLVHLSFAAITSHYWGHVHEPKDLQVIESPEFKSRAVHGQLGGTAVPRMRSIIPSISQAGLTADVDDRHQVPVHEPPLRLCGISGTVPSYGRRCGRLVQFSVIAIQLDPCPESPQRLLSIASRRIASHRIASHRIESASSDSCLIWA